MGAVTAAGMVAEAKAQIQNLTPQEVESELSHNGTTLIDLREAHEVSDNGAIPGSIHAPRGMIEFYADPTSPYYRTEFDPDSRIILTCASGGRSALTVMTLQRMGYRNVAHLDGGFKAWREQGYPVAGK